MKRIIIQIVLISLAAFFAYMIWDTIQTPIKFEKEKKVRYDKVIERLKNIRKAQLAYKDVHEKFSGDWDSLISFVKYDSIPQVRKIGMLTDEMVEKGMTEQDALRQGLIIRDTIKASVLEEVFGQRFDVDQLKVIPHSKGEIFWLGQTIITTGSGVKVPVFEARAHNNQILVELMADFDQQIINLNEQRRKNNRYPGLKVGSVEEPNNNAGNWE